MDDYLAIFGTAAHTAFGFQFPAQVGEVVVGAHKAFNQSDSLATPVVALDADAQRLTVGSERLDCGLVVGEAGLVE